MLKSMVSCLAVLLFACVGQSAVVDVGIVVVDGEDGSLTEEAGILQGIIDAGGVFTSPATVVLDDILLPRTLAGVAVITREPGETWGFAPTTTSVAYFSDDSGNTFNGLQAAFASNDFDGLLQRGLRAGPDGILWTADDIEVFGTDHDVDAMVLFGFAVSIDDTLANRVYYIDEIEFDVTVQFVTVAYPIPTVINFSEATTTVSTVPDIPEPASIALLTLGMLCLIKRP